MENDIILLGDSYPCDLIEGDTLWVYQGKNDYGYDAWFGVRQS